MPQKVLYLRSYLLYFTQQEESKCQDQEEEAREGQEAAWGRVDLEGHLQEDPAPAFSGQEAAGLGRAQAAFMAAPGTMAPAVFTAAPGIITAPACLLRITITMALAGALVLARAQAVSGGLRVPRAITTAAVAAGVAASSPFLLC